MLARRTSCIQTYSGMYYKRKGLDLIVLDFSAGQIDSLSRDRFVSNEVVLVRIIVALICRGEYDRCKKVTFNSQRDAALQQNLPRTSNNEDRASIGRRRV